jgi:hypothetical protein
MKDSVIGAIKDREIKMHPRGYFTFRTTLTLIGAVMLFFVILFVTSFMMFALDQNGGLYAIHFGPSGWIIFFSSLPWSLLLLSIVLIFILWILLRRYSLVYRQPFLYALLSLVIVISLASFFLPADLIQGGIFHYISRNPIPGVTNIYQFETAPGSGVYRGQVIIIATSSFILGNSFGQTSTVFMVSGDSSELTEVMPGDYVIILGHNMATGTIEASGVERIVSYQ